MDSNSVTQNDIVHIKSFLFFSSHGFCCWVKELMLPWFLLSPEYPPLQCPSIDPRTITGTFDPRNYFIALVSFFISFFCSSHYFLTSFIFSNRAVYSSLYFHFNLDSNLVQIPFKSVNCFIQLSIHFARALHFTWLTLKLSLKSANVVIHQTWFFFRKKYFCSTEKCRIFTLSSCWVLAFLKKGAM